MPLIYQKRIFRSDLVTNPEVYYVFGDNAERWGRGGQAKEMRGEKNAIGIPTKKSPYEDFRDCETAMMHVSAGLEEVEDRLAEGCVVVFPTDGIGTGLSSLSKNYPEITDYINETLSFYRVEY